MMSNSRRRPVKEGVLVVPGEKIGSAEFLTPRRGSYKKGQYVYSMTFGRVSITESSSDKGTEIVDIFSTKRSKSLDVLKVGCSVLGRVSRISTQQVAIEILAGENVGPLKDSRQGVIRKDDIAKGPLEQLVVADCFRPGDLVLARIISLGDVRRYILSTAEDNLGVVRPSISEKNASEILGKTIGKRKLAESMDEREVKQLLQPKM